ncbi:MAG: hypothetical protein A2600_11880 [Candidatus Lambdaproteobacteria bacterium RIFOXYD1_FULL_56_27]|uniref:RloB-like protein n=1 Tax=Candidatus Lambdaproteobacteria bacterium RIFOXYD2_FULL_56_26 TaxID=1817773 RepID=A0A1F6GXD5_9PROT|nr:MAG: hypothetical protein A2426_12215 [Candidatus Lambdaproteobacteria bacterium RIFOXYC1_FULL_56_13]OGH02798.1 MAG: hypothetical protein A2557_02995 [Candidatus Lambdaproteobacteria bacterium RIFOXYD2_FULL_56_26]OGH08041.1 MAG: hypothetical protein A2600_11880 [Candidatus Lambdaproteobacteria bacterium RIFOXYD1_FULL_56_27]
MERKVGGREQKKLLIVCLGEKTEKAYFESFKTQSGHKVVVLGMGVNPSNLVAKAKGHIGHSKKNYSQVWLVFDQDQFGADIGLAIRQAGEEGYKVALSVKQFEHWLLLHFDSYKAPLNAKDYAKKLGKHLGREYDKTLTPSDLEKLAQGREVAIERARAMNHGDDPSTSVWELVSTLKEYCG